MSIKQVPQNLRPREKAIAYGYKYLSDVEIIAIILRTGSKKYNALGLAQFILDKFGGLNGLRNSNFEDLVDIHGVGQAKATEILCVIELSNRILKARIRELQYINNPSSIFSLYQKRFESVMQEHFIIICLNAKNGIIDEKTIFIGSLSQSIVHPREVFKFIISCSASSFICLHNHPSGDPRPSDNDIEVTKNLIKIANLFGIPLLDHIIVGDSYFSFKENNII